jgi:hypothetical protein
MPLMSGSIVSPNSMVTALSPQGRIFGVGTMNLLAFRKRPQTLKSHIAGDRATGPPASRHAWRAGEGGSWHPAALTSF